MQNRHQYFCGSRSFKTYELITYHCLIWLEYNFVVLIYCLTLFYHDNIILKGVMDERVPRSLCLIQENSWTCEPFKIHSLILIGLLQIKSIYMYFRINLICGDFYKLEKLPTYGRNNTSSLLESLKNDGTCLSLSNLLQEMFDLVHKDLHDIRELHGFFNC